MENTLVTAHRQKVVTDSLRVAENFKKQHKIVLKKIETLMQDDEKDRLHFVPILYTDSQNRAQRKYIMNRRSFSILSMGFTGKKALKWKNRFYDAFEFMEQRLLQQKNLSWQQFRLEGKQDRYELTDAIKNLVELAKKSGSKNAETYYETISKMVYKQLFNINKIPSNFRDSLGSSSLKQLRMVEWQASMWLNEAIETTNDYHQSYKEIKEKIKTLISVIGVISPYSQIDA